MALDLSINTMQSHPLDLSMKKDRGHHCRQMSSASAKGGMSRSALKRVSFAGNCSKATLRNKQQSTWCLKKRLLEYHREALEREKENQEIKYGCTAHCEKNLEAEGQAGEELRGDCAPHENQEAVYRGADSPHQAQQFSAFPVPTDPREWSRLDVQTWLTHMKMAFELGEVHPERFPMNGKALCLMSPDMFSYRVPSAGRMLFRDFRLRLARAMALQTGIP